MQACSACGVCILWKLFILGEGWKEYRTADTFILCLLCFLSSGIEDECP